MRNMFGVPPSGGLKIVRKEEDRVNAELQTMRNMFGVPPSGGLKSFERKKTA